MNNITILTVTNMDGSTSQQYQIAYPDGSFTVMTQEAYDKLPSNSSTPQAGA